MLARSSAAAAALSAQWQRRAGGTKEDDTEGAEADGAVRKEYVALVAGTASRGR